MKNYELPRTESGEVAMYDVDQDLVSAGNVLKRKAVIDALLANARAEERERCAKIAERALWDQDRGHAASVAGQAIRNMGETK